MGARHRSTRAAACVIVLALAGLLAVGCTGASDRRTSSPRPDSPCAPRGDEKPSKALLRCGERSVAFIETPWASGTGVVIEAGGRSYVLTNLHVVDPFATADVVVGGVSDVGRLPVVGADAASDIALLGPLPGGQEGVRPLPLGHPEVEKGDDVFLVGFPGTIDTDDTDLTITSGLVSRTRTSPEWDQTYIQSDALIGHGQSGGPLFAADGQVIGISGLAFEDGFALALSIQDVRRVVDELLVDPSSDVPLVPQDLSDDPGLAGAGQSAATVSIDVTTDDLVLYLPPSRRSQVWNLAVSGPAGRFYVDALDALEYEVIASNGVSEVEMFQELVAEAEELGEDPAVLAEEYGLGQAGGPVGEISPGVFQVTVPAGTPVELTIGSSSVEPVSLTWVSDLPLWPTTVPAAADGSLTLDTPVEGVLTSSQVGQGFTIDLLAGQRVELSASSPQGDLALSISPPGAEPADDPFEGDGEWFDDSGEGLYGLDVLEDYTAEVAGTHRIWLENYEYVSVAYRLEVRRR